MTGGTGSLGKTLVRELLSGRHGEPERVLVFSRDEAKQHEMRAELNNKWSATDDLTYQDYSKILRFRLGDVRARSDLDRALDGIDIVVHAAALKQVPSCEYFPEQAIHTNCLGAVNLVEMLRSPFHNVHTVIGLSTDKACHPVNVMGMTKALQERLLVSANLLTDRTKFVSVRYGNIAASRGSVIPLFLDQIEKGGPITVTSTEMTRFFMPAEDAVSTILEALRNAEAGEIVVRKAPALKLINLATVLAGGKLPPVQITGLRPGEKLHETLLTEEEGARSVERGDFLFIDPMLPELASRRAVTAGEPFGQEFRSDADVLNYQETEAYVSSWNLSGGLPMPRTDSRA